MTVCGIKDEAYLDNAKCKNDENQLMIITLANDDGQILQMGS